MSDVLTRICDDKRIHVAAQKANRSLADVEDAARSADAPRGFAKQLTARFQSGGFGLIAEVGARARRAADMRRLGFRTDGSIRSRVGEGDGLVIMRRPFAVVRGSPDARHA